MKTLHLWAMLFIAFSHLSVSSQIADPFCDGIVEEAEAYIYGERHIRKKSKEMFTEVLSCAEKGNAEAACIMGILYKDGIGCTLDFDRAREWFVLAHGLGSERAAYSLGYLYLKGLGNVEQDYGKAMEWFQKSEYPMSGHWLAKLYYFGYGVPKDRARAMGLLSKNPIYNSKVLLQQFMKDDDKTETDTIQIVGDKHFDQVFKDKETKGDSSFVSGPNEETVPVSIEGSWEGHLVEMDWSGGTMVRTLPLKLSVGGTKDGFGTVESEIEIAGHTSLGEGIWKDGVLTIFAGLATIEKQYTDHLDHPDLDYELLSISFSEKELGGSTYLIGRLETWIAQWAEPGPPMVMVLSQGELKLSNDILKAFAQQDKSFIKLYPNPFVGDLLIYYDLGTDAHVEVSLYDYYGSTRVETVANGFLEQGEHTHTVSGNDLKSGLYVVQITVNGKTHSKIVIKK